MKTAEDLLRRLLDHFYRQEDGQLAWSYTDDTPVRDVDSALARDLAEWLDAQKNPTNGT